MNGWGEFTAALAVFFASHFLPSVGGLRARLIERFGRRAYFSVYGALSLAILVWLIVAAARAPDVFLWPQANWMRWVPNLAMPVAAVLAAIGIGIRQPHTLGGRRSDRFDPADPGLAALSRHPLMLALALWAGAHVLPNGNLAHVLLFGGFAALALAAIPVFDARARRAMGPEAARAFFGATALLSLRPLASADWRARNLRALLVRAGVGLGAWWGALHLHEIVIGVSPFPV